MESDSRFKQLWSGASDSISEAMQPLKAKWDELDPTSRSYLKAGGSGAAALLLVTIVISTVWGVHSAKSELVEKQDLLTMIQSANEEMRRLKDSTAGIPAAGGGAAGAWPAYFEQVATTAGIDKAALNIAGEKAGASSDSTKETLADVSLKHVSIKQIVRYAHGLENGTRPVKLRNLLIDTKGDAEGYMDATFSVSGFALVAK